MVVLLASNLATRARSRALRPRKVSRRRPGSSAAGRASRALGQPGSWTRRRLEEGPDGAFPQPSEQLASIGGRDSPLGRRDGRRHAAAARRQQASRAAE